MNIGNALRTPASLLLATVAALSQAVSQWLERTPWLPWRVASQGGASPADGGRLHGLQVTIHASHTMPDLYSLSVKNTGRRTLQRLCLRYEPILLDAENFGVDTAFMSSQRARPTGHPIHIHQLEPGETLQFFRKGWAEAFRFEGLRNCVMEVQCALEPGDASAEAVAWCYAQVDLPNAMP